MKTFQVNGMGIDLWGFIVPWPLGFLWAFLLLILITGTTPARRGRGISRAERPLAYWIVTLFFTLIVFIFTAGWYCPQLLAEAALMFGSRKHATTIK